MYVLNSLYIYIYPKFSKKIGIGLIMIHAFSEVVCSYWKSWFLRQLKTWGKIANLLNEKQINKQKAEKTHNPKTVLKMIEGDSSLVFVLADKQPSRCFPSIFIFLIDVSHVKYVHWNVIYLKLKRLKRRSKVSSIKSLWCTL